MKGMTEHPIADYDKPINYRIVKKSFYAVRNECVLVYFNHSIQCNSNKELVEYLIKKNKYLAGCECREMMLYLPPRWCGYDN